MTHSLNILQGIAREEGFYEKTPTRALRNNNPGNLRYGHFTEAYGATGGDIAADQPGAPGMSVFPTSDIGFAALKALLELYVKVNPSIDVNDTIAKYAPNSENNTEAYTTNICSFCGCSPSTLLSDLLRILQTPVPVTALPPPAVVNNGDGVSTTT